MTGNKSLSLITSATMLIAIAGVPSAALAQSVSDDRITRQIDREQMVSDAVDAHRVSVSTNNGNVTLTGTVDNLLEKQQAGDIALATVGVISVTNNIEVRQSDRSASEIQSAAENALLLDPATDSYEVSVSVRDGAATLSGTVDSYAEKRLAEDVVAGVRGVRSITNNISVDYAETRADYEIQSEVAALLSHSVKVDDGLLEVAVDDGAVTLSGSVGSAAEKWRSYNMAWVAGVESVDVSDVEIKWWARDDMRRTDLYVSMTDPSIRDAVIDSLFLSPMVDSTNVVVSVANGNVTLTGTVDDLRAKRTAEDLASSVVGAWDVDNYLVVDAPTTMTDESLESAIGAALLRDAYVDRFDITVAVVNGHAHLYGHVDTKFEKNRAENTVAAIEGVVDVSNYLAVNDEWADEEDWEIAEDIRSELFWSPFVDSDDITVTVIDGVATLNGVVSTLEERADAVKNAYDGGARSVDNNLLVSYGPDPLLP